MSFIDSRRMNEGRKMENMIAGKKFLVVDDQESIRQVIHRSLQTLGASQVLIASNGAAALEQLKNHSVDIIISDWNMPKMNGVDLLKAVRQLPTAAQTPFLMITAETDRRRVVEVISAGVSDFLLKPFNLKELEAKITRSFCVGNPERMAEYTQQETQAPIKSDQPATLLVVDDTPSNIDVIVNLFRKEYRVKAASSGAQALKICAAAPPDIILLDVMMPQMNGFEVCEKLQESPETQGIPVIFLTSRNTAVDMEKGFDVGGVDYVVKPSEPSVVRARVRNHLRLKDSRDNLSQQLDLLVENTRLKEEMQYMMRHDLKTPLIGMMHHLSEMASDKTLDATNSERAKSVESAAYRMLAMINGSQDMKKMEKGLYIAKEQKVDIVAVLNRLKKDLAGICRDGLLELILELPQDKIALKGEEPLCYVMIANLLKNAIEAAPENSNIRVTLQCDNGRISLSIQNKGEVPLAIRDTFFDKYVTSNKADGTGIGTYSARLMVHAQCGDIVLDTSTPDSTTLTMTLPEFR